ncbi:FxLYD domain-containing protein [Streptomyces sp. CC219B]|uniref:FxLYD domain-containing protein n=1 Tax=Streptomyces sp. CC219B TaxID=3044574 RepID=UPI0024A97B1D|nr:FxLYD domain-containing protein [Streptomyces sp. CC219B]
MPGYRNRTLAVATAAVLAASAVLTGCSDDDTPASVASRAESVAESLASEADRRFDDIKNGVDAKDDVTVGDTSTDDGRATAEITAENTDDSTKSFTVQVDFNDPDGNHRDTVLVTVSDVPAGESKKATARSNRDLGGDVKAEVERAVRY